LSLKVSNAVLDGEIVALDDKGRPSFQALQHRATGKTHIGFYAFDLLVLDGRELKNIPLEERQRQLAKLVKGSSVLLSEPLPGTPTQIEKALRRQGLEGVVAKRRDSRYEPGKRSDAWIKVRFGQRQELVVGGFKPGGSNFDSILVGHYEGKKLYFAGKVRAGFTPHLRAEVFARLKPIKKCPFVNLPNSVGKSRWGEGITAEDMEGLKWVKPEVVVEVAFTEWTKGDNLRHAAFVGLRGDKAAQKVRRET